MSVTLTSAELQVQLSRVRVIDVREIAELEAGIIPGSVHIPLALLEERVHSVVPDRATPIVTVCASGVRSQIAQEKLSKLGYQQVRSLLGGMNFWRTHTEGAPVESRYARQIRLAEIGEVGQRKLETAKVLLVGAGGLGSPCALYLAAAGVGHIEIVDGDNVELTNLHRQIAHQTRSLGIAKAISAEATLAALNPEVTVTAHTVRLNAGNVNELAATCDVLVDGSDNLPTRYLLGAAAGRHRKPLVHGSVFRWEGQVTTFVPDGPCYRCLYPEPPATVSSCEEAGVLGAVTGVIGTLQATEVLKCILGAGTLLAGRLLTFDALTAEFREFKYSRAANCARDHLRESIGPST